jgi:hypothetical protein
MMDNRYWVIKSNKGILHKPNGQYLVFDTPTDAMRHIEEVCGNSPYLKPSILKRSVIKEDYIGNY